MKEENSRQQEGDRADQNAVWPSAKSLQLTNGKTRPMLDSKKCGGMW